MRFMMFMYPEIEEKDWVPSAEGVAEMGRYNEELRKAGLLLSLDGLRPPSDGGVVSFDGSGQATVTDGPFAEAKEVVAGYWLWECDSREDAIEWLKKAPFDGGAEIELRQIAELDDFDEQMTPELREAYERLGEQIEGG